MPARTTLKTEPSATIVRHSASLAGTFAVQLCSCLGGMPCPACSRSRYELTITKPCNIQASELPLQEPHLQGRQWCWQQASSCQRCWQLPPQHLAAASWPRWESWAHAAGGHKDASTWKAPACSLLSGQALLGLAVAAGCGVKQPAATTAEQHHRCWLTAHLGRS